MTNVNTAAAAAAAAAASVNPAGTDTPNSATATIAKAKKRADLYTVKGSSIAAALWLSIVSTPRAPKFIGMIGGVQVSGFLRSGAKGVFVDFVNSMPVDGMSIPVAKGNFRIMPSGIPKLVLSFPDKSKDVFMTPSLDLSQDVMIECGMNAGTLAVKQAELATRRTEKATLATAQAAPAAEAAAA